MPLEDEALAQGVLDSALRLGSTALWQAQPELGVAYWSQEMYGLLRLPPGTGQEPFDRFVQMVVEDDQPLVRALVDELQSTGSYLPATLRVRAGDGTVRHLVSSGQRVQARTKTESPLFVGVNFDVTELVEARAELRDAQDLLRRQVSVIQSVLEHAPIGLAVSVGSDISHVSRFATKMIELGHDTAHKWDAWQVYHLDGRKPARVEEMALSRAARGETIRSEEWLIRAADGRLVPVACNAGPVLNAQGESIGAVVAWYDISPFKNAQQAERAARMAAEGAIRQREVFAASIAHELRTPLSAVSGWTEILKRNPNPALLARGLNSISTSVEGMARLIDDFLDISRIGAGKLEVVRRPCDFAAVVSAAVDTIGPIAGAALVVVQWNAPARPANISGDPGRLQQAVMNLLTNAVKFSAEGGLVLVTLESRDGLAVLTVVDYGIGIEADRLGSIFDAFYQVDGSSVQRGGLGLGLTIAKHIADKHEGSLTASSQGAGRGTTFTLSLPLADT